MILFYNCALYIDYKKRAFYSYALNKKMFQSSLSRQKIGNN